MPRERRGRPYLGSIRSRRDTIRIAGSPPWSQQIVRITPADGCQRPVGVRETTRRQESRSWCPPRRSTTIVRTPLSAWYSAVLYAFVTSHSGFLTACACSIHAGGTDPHGGRITGLGGPIHSRFS